MFAPKKLVKSPSITILQRFPSENSPKDFSEEAIFPAIAGEPFPISCIYPCSPRPTRDLRVGFESRKCDFFAGGRIMLRLSTNCSLLAANIAGLPLAYQASDKPGYAPAGEQRRR